MRVGLQTASLSAEKLLFGLIKMKAGLELRVYQDRSDVDKPSDTLMAELEYLLATASRHTGEMFRLEEILETGSYDQQAELGLAGGQDPLDGQSLVQSKPEIDEKKLDNPSQGLPDPHPISTEMAEAKEKKKGRKPADPRHLVGNPLWANGRRIVLQNGLSNTSLFFLTIEVASKYTDAGLECGCCEAKITRHQRYVRCQVCSIQEGRNPHHHLVCLLTTPNSVVETGQSELMLPCCNDRI